MRRLLLALTLAMATVAGQEHQGHEGHKMPAGAAPHDMSTMQHETDPSMALLMQQSSGTALQPKAWPMPMLMTKAGDWHLMWMAQAIVVETQQSGPRGGDKLFSPNWGMLGAFHELAGGTVGLRTMVSLDPLTVTHRSYPLLFQTGETAFGRPLVDAQHPHDLLMELSAQYARRFAGKGVWNVYWAPVGDPALGPVAYPHRASAMDLPQAALGHHWQDATHIANNVLTAGISYGKVRIEASGLRGREPNENRWNIDMGAMDSWTTRFSVFPTDRWSAQVSTGRLNNPEATHAGDIVRSTASLQYVKPAPGRTWWAATLLFGQDYKVQESRASNSVLAEAVIPLKRKNIFIGRYEWSQRDELFENDHETGERIEAQTGQHAFNVSAFTAGYTRDLDLVRNLQSGVGASVSAYAIPQALQPYYGSHPWGVNVFVRVRLRAGE